MYLLRVIIFRYTKLKSPLDHHSRPRIATCTSIPLKNSDPISVIVKCQIIGYLIVLLWAQAHNNTATDEQI